MRKIMIFAAVGVAAASVFSQTFAAGKYGIGTPATEEQVLAWDIDVSPSGNTNLIGAGTAEDGEPIYQERCASCHGDFGDGGPSARYPILIGGSPEDLTEPNPDKTIGSYWPYASTVVDYIYRAMPFGDAQSLTPDEAYAISAWLLAENGVIDHDFVLSNENIGSIVMPNVDGFYMDDRPDTRVLAPGEQPCMTDCQPVIEIVHHASVLKVTPDSDVKGLSAE